MAVSTFTKTGNKATTTVKLDKAIFGVSVDNHELLKAAYIAHLHNGRINLARTKTRGMISGGGHKPWRQKGTGRARVGSSRTPIWRGGGVVFGPTGVENYSHRLPTAQKRTALRQALSLAANDNKCSVIEELVTKQPKTKELVALLQKIGALGRVLLVVETITPEFRRTMHNIADTKLVQAMYLTVFDIMNADRIVFTYASLADVEKWLGGTK